MSGPVTCLDLALAGQVLLWLLIWLLFLLTGEASIYHPLTIYLGFHGMVFVARPLLVYYLGFNSEFIYMRFDPSEQHLLRALLVSSLGLVAFSVSTLLSGWCKPRFQYPSVTPFGAADRQGLLAATFILMPLIAYSVHSLV